MNYSIWDIVYFVGFVIYVFIRGTFQSKTKQNEKVVQRADWRELALFAIVLVGSMLLPIAYLVSPLLSFANYSMPVFAHWIGVAVLILALWLFWRAHTDLGLNWSVTLEIRKEHTLITEGVYRGVRHPMYTAIFLFGLAQVLLLENWLAGWSALVSFAVMYFVRTPREERMLLDHFGEEYRSYMNRTGRLVPKLFGNASTS